MGRGKRAYISTHVMCCRRLFQNMQKIFSNSKSLCKAQTCEAHHRGSVFFHLRGASTADAFGEEATQVPADLHLQDAGGSLCWDQKGCPGARELHRVQVRLVHR